MILEIPDHCLNALQIESIRRLLADAKGMHWADITLRMGGRDVHYQADWLKSIIVRTETGAGR